MKVVALIPHYNHAATVGQVAQAMRAQGLPVLIVDDGSEPAAQQVLRDLAAADAQIQVVWRAQNGGKGAAVKSGFAAAAAAGHSHVLQVDADAQHQLADAQKLLQAAFRQPEALVCAEPVYGADAPKSRLYGRKITNFWIWVNTGSRDIRDGMCGFRLYPLAPVQALMQRHHIGERMDFDTDILVRLYWAGVPMVWVPTPVRYSAQGVSHFRVWRDNWLISKMHARLFFAILWQRMGGKP